MSKHTTVTPDEKATVTTDENATVTPDVTVESGEGSESATENPVAPVENAIDSDFYNPVPMNNIPHSPYLNNVIWPPGAVSDLSEQKMKDFINGHLKFFMKGKFKQADVEEKVRAEMVEYNVARRLRDNKKNEVHQYFRHKAQEQAESDYSLCTRFYIQFTFIQIQGFSHNFIAIYKTGEKPHHAIQFTRKSTHIRENGKQGWLRG